MPILRLNAGPETARVHGSTTAAHSSVRHAAKGTGPVIILVHGFKYDPDHPACCPHTSIFGWNTHPNRRKRASWLRPLGFGAGDPEEGLAIAFCWRARGNLWQAEGSARAAGTQLADVVRRLRTVAPARPIHVITHSMGSEVVFEALGHLARGAIHRIITLTGASYASRACAAMQTPAGLAVELFNVTSRENDVFDFLYERLIPSAVADDRAIGKGLVLPNAVNIQLDCPKTLAILPRFGGQIAMPARRVCHWSSYTRTGALAFYAHAVRQPSAVPLADLKAALPDTAAPRWSRVFARPRLALPLPMAQKTAS